MPFETLETGQMRRRIAVEKYGDPVRPIRRLQPPDEHPFEIPSDTGRLADELPAIHANVKPALTHGAVPVRQWRDARPRATLSPFASM